MLEYINSLDELFEAPKIAAYKSRPNRGYDGWSMSVRAREAYERGCMPKTNFKKHFKISEKVFQQFASDEDNFESEWHHTSAKFNKTDFYCPTAQGLEFLSQYSEVAQQLLDIMVEEYAMDLNKEKNYYPKNSWENPIPNAARRNAFWKDIDFDKVLRKSQNPNSMYASDFYRELIKRMEG